VSVPATAAPDVSVVIVHLGRSTLLRDCLRTLQDSLGRLATETIVVDNLSGAADVEEIAATHPGTRVLRLSERVGYGAATNRGIAESRGRFVLWCNNDLLFRARAVDRLVEFLDAHPEYGAACPRLLNPDGTFQPCFSLLHMTPLPLAVERLMLSRVLPRWDLGRHLIGHELAERDVAVAGGACSLLRRSALDAIGGVDERFFLYSEEYDLSRRLWDAGWRVRYLPSAEVVHLGSQTTVKAPGPGTYRFMVQAWRSHFAYLRKHHGAVAEWAYGVLFAATAVPRWAAARAVAAVAGVRGDARRAAAWDARARLHAYSARMALSAERREAASLASYPPTRGASR
jgi:N-acetylglucosaminyl-diphospho-decaprenol L-rhamnosyltransferase